MKLILTNSKLVFASANIVTKTASKTFAMGDAASLVISLDNIVKKNTPIEITVAGDSVVDSTGWEITIGGASFGYIPTGSSHIINEPIIINRITLIRSSIVAAGTINVTVKYAYEEFTPTYDTQTLTLTSSGGYALFELEEALTAPIYVQLIGSNPTGQVTASTGLKVHLLDASQNDLLELNRALVDTLVTIKSTDITTPVKYVKIDRNGMSQIAGTLQVSLVK